MEDMWVRKLHWSEAQDGEWQRHSGILRLNCVHPGGCELIVKFRLFTQINEVVIYAK